ncbi:neurotrypsin-like [Mya arenaria]|uniref:neurotrypsin-like n=1 Tax=Mya arenaria TaxID=6604 RepID=UPI0022E6B0A5|nr:neurotrypsin-like [Mya arenaria]
MELKLFHIGLLQVILQLHFGTASNTIRLVGGSNQYNGRVEILHDGAWGTVCDDEFTDTNALVVCKMLNYPTAGAKAITNLIDLPIAPSQIWLDQFRCTGCEQSIVDCLHLLPWGSHDCLHNEDVGVVCSSTASNTDIRLIGGSNQYSGRVEIFHNDIWGTVCNNELDDTNAAVVCRMLNLPTAGARVITNLIGYPTAPVQIWLADVSCSGCEKSFDDCYHSNLLDSHNCSHNEDVGVVCPSLSADEPTSIASTVRTVSIITPTNNESSNIVLLVIPTAVSCSLVLCLLVGGLVYCKRTGIHCFLHRQQQENRESCQQNLRNKSQSGECSQVQNSTNSNKCNVGVEENATIGVNNEIGMPMETPPDQLEDTNGNEMDSNDSDIRIVTNCALDGAEGGEIMSKV